MKEFINTLEDELLENANPRIAKEQKAYMRNQFEYFGIKAPLRREIQRPFLLIQYLPPKEDLENLVHELWQKPQRDYQYIAQELTQKYIKQFNVKDIELLEFMVTHKSWWDTVDFIAANLMGAYFNKYPEQRKSIVKKWLASGNIWLQRSALLFQLKYKKDLDTLLLSEIINQLLGSKEFFINKAIGWILREYSKTNPHWVIEFANQTSLNPLSRREALRLLK